jgi:hypothetical protein
VHAGLPPATAFVDLLTRSGLKTAIEKGLDSASRIYGLPKLTTTQVNSSVTAGLVMAVIVSLVSVLLWFSSRQRARTASGRLGSRHHVSSGSTP